MKTATQPVESNTPDAQTEKRKKILVVEDDTSFRESLRKVLANEGYDVLDAASGREGLEVLSRSRVDLILLDFFLGDINGFDFLDQTMGQKRPPVIVISAFTSSHLSSEALVRGATDCLAKPIKKLDLLEAIRKTMRGVGG